MNLTIIMPCRNIIYSTSSLLLQAFGLNFFGINPTSCGFSIWLVTSFES
jgi:hypothetical protein